MNIKLKGGYPIIRNQMRVVKNIQRKDDRMNSPKYAYYLKATG